MGGNIGPSTDLTVTSQSDHPGTGKDSVRSRRALRCKACVRWLSAGLGGKPTGKIKCAISQDVRRSGSGIQVVSGGRPLCPDACSACHSIPPHGHGSQRACGEEQIRAHCASPRVAPASSGHPRATAFRPRA
eukprot:2852833-Amphidinium_carterae.1